MNQSSLSSLFNFLSQVIVIFQLLYLCAIGLHITLTQFHNLYKLCKLCKSRAGLVGTHGYPDPTLGMGLGRRLAT
jgi:uncharacterized integral membrane protein